ncbi:hypothetical protein [Sphingorhabdus sp.]|uniref:hypothetical protein n=1 Tax=Sphingorhabdus sp. TaxID=1902408 RepID=UPI00391C5659
MVVGFGSLHASGQYTPNITSVPGFTSEHDELRLANLRIMVVEDEVLVAMAIEDALVSAGATVIGPAMTVSSGLVLLDREDEIDGAILDINVDNELVFPIAERLRDQGIPVIFHTAYANNVEMQATFPDAIICTKPALNEELVAVAAARFG